MQKNCNRLNITRTGHMSSIIIPWQQSQYFRLSFILFYSILFYYYHKPDHQNSTTVRQTRHLVQALPTLEELRIRNSN